MAAYHHLSRRAMRKGRNAAIRQRITGKAPVNPYSPYKKSHMYFDWGVEQANRALDQLLGIGS